MEKTYILKTNCKEDVIPFFRLKTGLAKKEIAKRLGITKPTWDRYEKEPEMIPTFLFEKLENVFGPEFIDYYMDNKLYVK